MARRDGLMRLHKRLLARREALLKALAGELDDLRGQVRSELSGNDPADAAFDASTNEIGSQLAELEARELSQIEWALKRLVQGTYGKCEECAKKIPVARLNALPYSTCCVECQMERDRHGGWGGRHGHADWEKIYEFEPKNDEPKVDLSDLEMDLTK
jgi:DnaK suppressor protein